MRCARVAWVHVDIISKDLCLLILFVLCFNVQNGDYNVLPKDLRDEKVFQVAANLQDLKEEYLKEVQTLFATSVARCTLEPL